ncbi:MAG: hypothetical protein HZA01_06900 [Nitrospinae bacterium]|nr:hypothetical protein [Nitrospinota bacterium]
MIAREHPVLGSLRVSPVELERLEEDSLEYARKAIRAFYSAVAIDDENLKKVCIVEKFFHLKDKIDELPHRLLDEVFNHPKSDDPYRQRRRKGRYRKIQ